MRSKTLSPLSSYSPTTKAKSKRRYSGKNQSQHASPSLHKYFTVVDSKGASEENNPPAKTDSDEITNAHKRRKVEDNDVAIDGAQVDSTLQPISLLEKGAPCPQCGEMVVGCMTEHLDYHVAMELQESLNETSFDKITKHRSKETGKTNTGHPPSQEKIQVFFRRK